MNYQPILEKVKAAALSKGDRIEFPDNGDEVLVIKEERVKDQHSFTLGVGKALSFNFRYFDVKGKVLSDSFPSFSDSSVRIEPKIIQKTKGAEYITVKFPEGFIRSVDEASWQDKFSNLNDLLEFFNNFGKKDLNSLFEDIKNLQEE